MRCLHRTHQLSDGVVNDLLPVVDDAVSVVLDEVLRPIASLQLTRTQYHVNAMSNLNSVQFNYTSLTLGSS